MNHPVPPPRPGNTGGLSVEKNKTEKEKPKVQLVGEDGNVFSIIGRCRKALKRAGQHKEVNEMVERAMKAHSYHEALGIVQEYVEAK